MLVITNKYALVEEATFDTREQKEEESGHTDQPSSSKGHDKKREGDCAVNIVEQPQRNKVYRPRSGKFVDEVLKMARTADQEKKPE
jgi:zona occludens toxin (predicted ATPase)